MAFPTEFQAVLDKLEPEVRQAFLDALSKITSSAQINTIIAHIEAGNVEAAILALKVDPTFFQPLDRLLSEAFYQGGVTALAALPKIPDPFRAVQRFLASMEDMTAPKHGDESSSQPSSPALKVSSRE
ncbi:hypothetical protein JZX87_10045 [Agrobacterium sp. Ap1]|uniref:hypothetical protein n=1 Tax=Agrobacterium sp. Ap1 TaxID=2815337 RepID=UPI001A8E6BC2|nr:hypothetical protein [Agrobacterium sp. Ap1]MBO0141503.1 hypothetical protein [Agrobacterium sp. Ap1]